jgi:hypothetical protein
MTCRPLLKPVLKTTAAHVARVVTTVVAPALLGTVRQHVLLRADPLALPPHRQMEATNPQRHSVLMPKKLPLSASAR